MDQTSIRIPTRSRRQALNWSLVRASQGIECVIERPDADAGWGLLVADLDHAPALKAIHQYRIENRNWPWQRKVLQPGILFDWGSIAWAFLLVFFYWLDARIGLRAEGVMDPTAVAQGQWWRLFTAVWLHADAAHLAANTTIGLVLLGFTMGRYGTGAGLLTAYLAGAGGMGAPASLPASARSHPLAGEEASVPKQEAATAQPVQTTSGAKYKLGGILGGIMLFVMLGLTPGTDLAAHAGGFFTGLVVGGIMALSDANSHSGRANLVCGGLFVAGVVAPWWLALTHG